MRAEPLEFHFAIPQPQFGHNRVPKPESRGPPFQLLAALSTCRMCGCSGRDSNPDGVAPEGF